jgi:predicted deacylase
MDIKQFHFKAEKAGPSVLILGAIHGNEKCGSKAAQNLIAQIESGTLELVCGAVTFIPICNPKAYDANQRYIDVNLNRVIKQHDAPSLYEEHLANQITPIIAAHDFTLDLHSIHSKGSSFAFLDFPHQDAQGVCAVLGVETIITGWPDMYEDTDDATTLSFAHEAGKASVTVECGQHDAPKAVEVAQETILNTLKYYGIIAGQAKPTQHCSFVQAKHRIVKENEGILGDGTINNIQHMRAVKKGEKVAEYSNGNIVKAPEDGVILIPFTEAQIGDEWFYVGTLLAKKSV